MTPESPEFIEIRNTGGAGQSMKGWTVSDSAATSGHTFTFSDFTLGQGSSVKVHTESGADNATDLFWDRKCNETIHVQCIWNDAGDTATLKNSIGIVASIFSY